MPKISHFDPGYHFQSVVNNGDKITKEEVTNFTKARFSWLYNKLIAVNYRHRSFIFCGRSYFQWATGVEEPGRSNIDPIQNQLIQQGGAGCGTENRLIFCCVYAKAQGFTEDVGDNFHSL